MTPKRMEPSNTQYRERVRHHLQAALDATDTPEKEFHIREALQLLSIEKRKIRTTHCSSHLLSEPKGFNRAISAAVVFRRVPA